MEKKYEILKNGLDDYVLKYKDKEIKFNSVVKIVDKMQEVNKNARMKMILDLSKQGMTVKDLIIEEKKDGKTYYNNSNKEELEQAYIQEETSKVFQGAIKEMLGMELMELLQEIGLENEEEIKEFSTELGKIMVGNFPRR